MGVDHGGADAGMPEQHLHDTDVGALLEEPGREAVTQRVRAEVVIETTGRPGEIEGSSSRPNGQMIVALAIGEEPFLAAMSLPDRAEHVECGVRQRQGPLFVALADDPQEHSLGVDGREGQSDGFTDPQPAGIDQREAAAVDRILDRGNQAAAVLVALNVGKTLAIGLPDFFLVSSGQS